MDYLMIVNRENLSSKDNLGEIVLASKNINGKAIYLEKETNYHIKKLLKEVNSIKEFRKIEIESGYRSLEKQQKVFDYYVNEIGYENACKRVAPVGASEHHTGLALDIALVVNGKYIEPTGEEAELIWLFKNAHKYGFILRYPKNKESITGYDYEPWHFRYVGSPKKALDIKNSGLTLEEYTKTKI